MTCMKIITWNDSTWYSGTLTSVVKVGTYAEK